VLQPEKGGDPSVVRESQKKRGAPEEIVEEVLRMYKEWTQLGFELNGLQKESNAIQKDITARRKAKENADELMHRKAGVDYKIGELRPQVEGAEAKMRTKAGLIGNIVGDKVPISQTEVRSGR
jgi:seryl-tRNA synthetase